MSQEILKAIEETLYMVFFSGFLSALVGIPLGILLAVTAKGHIQENIYLYQALAGIVNAVRSIPFIILMIAIIPFTRALIGSSIGTNAAVVPLTLSAIPFIARLAEESIRKVPQGLIEAGNAMGASPYQIVLKILIPEAKSGLVNDVTITLVNLVGYSAMAGTIGGGGLGSLAIHYGYQRFDVNIMIITVVILIVIVQLLQWIGDTIAKRLSHKK